MTDRLAEIAARLAKAESLSTTNLTPEQKAALVDYGAYIREFLTHLQAQADTIARLEGERDAALSPHMAAGLLVTLKSECEQQHARAEAAEQRLARLEGALREMVLTFDGQTEPLHPISWQVPLAAAIAALAASPEAT